MSGSVQWPEWIHVRRGAAPIVLLAPHGGRRLARREPGRHKVNDLHTAELTLELAAAWGASAIVNPARDRNELDLNRLDQVRRDAPWLLELLAEMLGDAAARTGHATLLVVHGWNVSQAVCDVGVGLTGLPAGDCELPATCTVSRSFLGGALPALQAEAAREGVSFTLGARYPALHVNNLLQACARRAASDEHPAVRALATLACEERLDAVQLELAIPLRWPGAGREALTRVLGRTVAARRPAIGDPPPPGLAAAAGPVTDRLGLQFAGGSLLGLAGIDIGAHGAVAGRFLVSTGADRLALFTGELARAGGDGGLTVPPLELAVAADGGARLRFGGPLLTFPMLTPFLDLENGLASAAIVEAAADLRFTPAASTSGLERFGDLAGHVVIDGERHEVATTALFGGGAGAAPAPGTRLRVVLPGSPLGTVSLRAEDTPLATGSGTWSAALAGVSVHGSDRRSIRADAALALERGTGTVTFALDDGSGTVTTHAGTLERLIPVRRPGRPGTVLVTTWARCLVADWPVGWLELTREVPAMPRTPRP